MQEGEEDELFDEAIRQNITELVASAFGTHSSEAGSTHITNPGMEVQDVTVYVDSRKADNNNESVQDNKSGSNNQPSVFKTNNEGSISIQNVPFVPSFFETPISITVRNEDKEGRIDDTSPNTPGTISVSTISNRDFYSFQHYK